MCYVQSLTSPKQGLALYPAQYTYAQPQQVQVAQPAPKAVAAPKPAPAPAQITYQYPQPYGYAAYPVQVAMPNYPVPVPEPKQSAAKIKDKPKVEEAEKKEEGAKTRAWIGRTTKQVDEDNVRMAINEGLYKPNDIVPKGARDDQLFWCIETDGSNTLRTFRTIEDDMHPGKWKVDPRYGSLYFVREKEKEKEKKK